MRIMPSELNKLSTRGRDQGKRQGRNIASCRQSRGRQKQQPKRRRKRRAANNTRYPAQRRRRDRVRGKLPNHQRRRNVLRRKLTPFDVSRVTFQSTPSRGPWRKRRHHQSPGISPRQYQQVDCSKLHDKIRPRDRQHDSTLPSFKTLEYPVHRHRRFLLRRVRQTEVF
jgi:hypothetical protein